MTYLLVVRLITAPSYAISCVLAILKPVAHSLISDKCPVTDQRAWITWIPKLFAYDQTKVHPEFGTLVPFITLRKLNQTLKLTTVFMICAHIGN